MGTPRAALTSANAKRTVPGIAPPETDNNRRTDADTTLAGRPSAEGDIAVTSNIGIATYQPVVALFAGVLILLMPRTVNYVIALYLIFYGVIGLGLLR
jgi:hypothetical protein